MQSKETTICPICRKETPLENNFCLYCRYPISVKKINEFTKGELALYLSDFLEVIRDNKSFFNNKELEEIYTELIYLNWLRPESALFRFIEADVLLGFKEKYLNYPLLDLGCGDGLFISILFGARINKIYDAYESIDFSKTDIYDDYKKSPENFLIEKSGRIGFGIDIKKNMVMKAKNLGTYDEVKLGDARALPFENNCVNSVFSNMIDDIKEEELEQVFREANRILKKGGYFVFTTPTQRFREFLLYYNKAQESKKQGDMEKYKLFLELDRGRSEWEPKSLSLWKELFKKTSFELVQYVEYGSKDMLQFWDTGFRPFFHYLMDVRNILKHNEMLLHAKGVFVEIMKNYLLKYAKNQISSEGAFSIIVAKKVNANEKRR